MLRAVKLNNKLCLRTVKINYVIINDLLSCKCNAISLSVWFEVIVPKMFFFFVMFFLSVFAKLT